MREINWFGLAAGIIMLVMLAASFFLPWWQLTVGAGLMRINASPIATTFDLLGEQFLIPIIFAINISTILLFIVAGALMLIYSLLPTKSYSKHLLSFSYKKPIYVLISFIAVLLIMNAVASFLGVNFPVMGSTTFNFPQQLAFGSGVEVSTSMTAEFMLPFWLALAAAILCVIARLYHPRLTSKKTTANPTSIVQSTST
ncbi:MAG: hypothetical protein NWE98_02680 [Candidatus Bathyarchaeota archaeon]|nr:hypothetical protein [Candidatus Bathyarchaeota archaeon]